MTAVLDKFKRVHHLFDPHAGVLYCYIAKNASSTLKFHFFKRKMSAEGSELCDEELNRNIHPISKEQSLLNHPTDISQRNYAFCVVRNPFSRIASAFLDKFVQSKPLPKYAEQLMNEYSFGKTFDEWTFSDFISSLIESDLNTFNEHWMPQYLHLFNDVDYDLIAMENFPLHKRLTQLYGDISFNVREHSLQYYKTDVPAYSLPLSNLKRTFEDTKTVPMWEDLFNPDLEEKFREVFDRDIDLYALAKKHANEGTSIKHGTADSKKSTMTIFSDPNSESSGALISLVVPVYNVEKYIDECMKTIAQQDDDNFEVVVIDDGGKDNSIRIVKNYADRINTLRIIKQSNKGLGGARNEGVRKASGEFVIFIDSDDIVSPSLISTLRSRQQEGDYDIVSTKFLLVTKYGKTIGPPLETSSPILNPPLTHYERVLGVLSPSISCARLYRKSLLISSGVSFPDRIPHEDLFFTYKLLRIASHSQISEYLYFWRQHEESISKNLTLDHLNVLLKLRQDTYEYLDGVSAAPLEYALAARRNLVMLQNFYRKALERKGDILKCFFDILDSTQAEILEDFNRIERSEIREVYAPKQLSKIIKYTKRQSANPNHKARKHDNIIDFAFFPLRAYHIEESLTVAQLLRKQGFRVEIVETDAYRKGKSEVLDAAKQKGIHLFHLRDLFDSHSQIRCVVLFNDWDPLMRVIAKICYESGILTVGWVEGVQDYKDVDTGRTRYPYLRSQQVILPGRFDAKYFHNTDQIIHIGEVVRIKPLWEKRYHKNLLYGYNRVLINSNFSYGVLEEYRDQWVQQAVEACIESGFKPVLSRHPFDEGETYEEYETKESFYNALKTCSLSIHRFGSGILESLACGIPVIYFNPHGEKVDKFTTPGAAFIIASTQEKLKYVLEAKHYHWDEVKAEAFLELHTGLSCLTEKPGEKIVRILGNALNKKNPPSDKLSIRLAEMNEIGQRSRLLSIAKKIGPLYKNTAPKISSFDHDFGRYYPNLLETATANNPEAHKKKIQDLLPVQFLYALLGVWLKRPSSVFLKILRFSKRSVVNIWKKHSITATIFALLIILLIMLPAYPALRSYAVYFWASALLLFTAGMGSTFMVKIFQLLHHQKSSLSLIDDQIFSLKRQFNDTVKANSVQIDQLSKEITTLANSLDCIRREINNQTFVLKNQLNDTTRSHNLQVDRLSKKVKGIETSLVNIRNDIEHSNSEQEDLSYRFESIELKVNQNKLFERFNRTLEPDHIDSFLNVWSPRLCLNTTKTSITYMANRIQVIEQQSIGRLATQIQDGILRSLVCSASSTNQLEILEIGTLFGIGLSILYDYNCGRFDTVHATAIDPLYGYYDKMVPDSLLNIPVSKSVFWRNMALSGVPREDITLIAGLSTDPDIISTAYLKSYDILIIDADHSYDGVKADFENYLRTVNPGGFIVFDDYQTPNWPDVKLFVDEEVMQRKDLKFLGAEWRTAVFQVLPNKKES
jgi:glycosyltransferase involved in cell wall biosynthesis/predicted O-methyltransferase YrrM